MSYALLDVEITQALSPVRLGPDETGIAVLVRISNRPVGFFIREMPAAAVVGADQLGDLISAETRTTVLRHFLAEELAPRHLTVPSVDLTVVVADRGRPDLLRRCLSALDAMRGKDRNPFRTVVIGSAPVATGVVGTVTVQHDVEHIGVEGSSLDAIRNRAIAVCKSHLIAFINDDTVVDAGWLEGVQRAFHRSPGASAVTGQVLPLDLRDPMLLAVARMGCLRRDFQPIRFSGPIRRGHRLYPASPGILGSGSNMTFTCDTLRGLGGFGAHVGRGRRHLEDGALDMLHRVVRSGGSVVYEPGALVLRGGSWQQELRDHRWSRGAVLDAFWLQAYRDETDIRPLLRRMVFERIGDRLGGTGGQGGRGGDGGSPQRRLRAPRSYLAPSEVVHVQLSQPLAPIGRPPDGRAVYLVFWHGQLPLGDVTLTADELPIGPEELALIAADAVVSAVGDRIFPDGFLAPLPTDDCAAAASAPTDYTALVGATQPLALLAQAVVPGRTPRPSVSLVVCTRDRPAQLERCLASIASLDERPHEILVVDNHPSDGRTRSVVAEWPQVGYLPEWRQGLSIARNTGARAASGEVVAYTDDDVTVHPDWLVRLTECFSSPNVAAATGLVLAAELDTVAQVAFERSVGGFNCGYRALVFDSGFFARTLRRAVPVWRIGAGANMAVRRHTLLDAGGFDERLGAGAAGCSEDSELWYRLLAAGGECRYNPAAVVFHHHRRDGDQLETQTLQYMRGHVAALWIQFAMYHHWGNLRRIAIQIPRHLARRALRDVLFAGPIERRALGAQVAGYFAGAAMPIARRLDAPRRGATSPVQALSSVSRLSTD